MIKAGIIGATGFAGSELLRLLLGHELVSIKTLADISHIGRPAHEVFPFLRGCDKQLCGLVIEEPDADRLAHDCDVIFTAMPHGKAVLPALKIFRAGKRLIDIGTDFRFRDPEVYREWYNLCHDAPELLKEAKYGLPELFRTELFGASVIGNPGCYPTAAILAIFPLLKAGLASPNSIIIDAKSGVSGAGRTPSAANIYCEANESVKAYNIGIHRHTPEIEMVAERVSGISQTILFTPHLVPMSRGILATAYADVPGAITAEELHRLYMKTYAGERFVVVHPLGVHPQTKWAAGTNECHLGIAYDPRTKWVIITAAIDNLIKGAAGQAIQNMNIMFGFPEMQGLELSPILP